MEKYIKSPLNYTGGKYKLLGQILPLFPEKINTFVDLFAGGCNVAINTKSNKKICNDVESHVMSLMEYFKNADGKNVIDDVTRVISKYGLSDTTSNGYEFYGCNSSQGVGGYNKDKYLRLRDDYNADTSNDIYFFTTVIFSFSNQIRFNSDGKFNMPVNKRDFNANVKKNTINFVDSLDDSFEFQSKDFRQFDFSLLDGDDLVYCDPPYLITTASYNENGGWTETDDIDLMKLLDSLNERGIKFAMSNVLAHKGKTNDGLIEWSKKYNVHKINANYGNSNYHAKDKSKNNTVEVLITNY